MRRRVSSLLVTSVVALVATTWGASSSAWVAVTADPPLGATLAASDGAFTVVAAGDIACDPGNPAFNRGRGVGSWCRAAATARVVRGLGANAILTLGDHQYDDGRGRAFRVSYDASWGRFRDRVHPVPGNHEYWSSDAATGYFSYFGKRAGDAGDGWYSFDAARWHVVALNTNCDRIACGPDSRQARWLRADLEASPASCTLAFMHHPLVSSGPHGDDPMLAGALWKMMYKAGVDVALAGHDHLYERFAPLRPDLKRDADTGIRTFVVGTGGAQHYPVEERTRFSQQINATTFGVLQMVLRPGSYRWRFVPAAGGTYTDAGSGSCHGVPSV